MKPIKYLVIGGGATGLSIAGYLGAAGMDVTLLARGKSLEAVRKNGIGIFGCQREVQAWVKTASEEEYREKADVIFLCVKGYSVESTLPLIRRASDQGTAVIPILNLYGTGERIAPQLPGVQVLNGCIYIAASVEAPGRVRRSSEIFRIVYGRTDGKKDSPLLAGVERDLKAAGIEPVYTDQVRRDTLMKYAMVSPMAAVGAYCDVSAGAMQRPGEMREMYAACIGEIVRLAAAMGIVFPVDLVKVNLGILDDLTPEYTTSMQKDLKRGGPNEMDGLIFEMVRLGHKYQVPVPCYEKIAKRFGMCYT